MVIFIDESGIHKVEGYSTVVLVYVETQNFEKLEKEISKIEKDLRVYSFHWADERWLIREKFLRWICELDFSFKVAILQNPIRIDREIEKILQHLVVEKNIKKILIDGKKPKWYERKLKKILRDKGISVKKLKTVKREESEPGLRLADCLAGFTRYYLEHPYNDMVENFYKKLSKKITVQLRTVS